MRFLLKANKTAKIWVIGKWQVLLSIFTLFVMLLLVIQPKVYMQSCLQGIVIWGNSVLPALFPFFFFSSVLIRLNMVEIWGQKLSPLMQKLFNTPGSSGVIYLLSIISGYPVGAKLTSELYQKGIFTSEQVVRINAFASTSGPLFVIGAVGVGMFGNHLCGVLMLISHILGALLNGLLYRNYGNQKCIQVKSLNTKPNDLANSMYDSIIAILIVGGYIVIFNIIIDMMININLIGSFCLLINTIFGIDTNVMSGIMSGIIEVTRGCLDIKNSTIPLTLATPICCALISFGGLSILLQAITFLSKCKIKIRFYILQKFTHAIISGLICLLLVNIFI